LLAPLLAWTQEAPPNDMFSAATPLNLVAGQTNIITGSNLGATRESGERGLLLLPVGRSVWWKWTATASETVYINTSGTAFDTMLAVVTGNAVSSLSTVAWDDDHGSNGTSVVSFLATPGVEYHIELDGYTSGIKSRVATFPATNQVNTGAGNFVLNIWRGPLPPGLIIQPQNLALRTGTTATLSAAATGAAPLSYQWSKDGSPLAGATSPSYFLPNAQPAQSGTYSVVVTNALGTVTSSNALVTIGDIVFTTQPQSLSCGLGYPVSWSAVASSSLPVAYQWQKDGRPIAGATASTYSLAAAQLTDAAAYSVTASNALGMVTSSNALLTLVPYTFTTLAGLPGSADCLDGTGSAARFLRPMGVALDRAGNLYVTEHSHTVRKVTPEGVVTTVAGLAKVTGTNDGPGSLARFYRPEGIAVDSADNLYVLDNFNDTIRKITPEGMVATIAGVPNAYSWRDGPAQTAYFAAPCGIALDRAGNLYVAEWSNNGVRKITPDGCVTTLMGSKASLNMPSGIAVDPAGDLFVTTQGGAIVKATPYGFITTTLATLTAPYGGALDTAGNYYVAGSISYVGNAVYRISPDKKIITLAGVKDAIGSADGAGGAARFQSGVSGITVDQLGNLYVADNGNHTIRKGVPFAVTTLPQSQAVPAGTSVSLSVAAEGPGRFAYQWRFQGSPLAGQTNTTLALG
ncbi:MAG TPA: immunoglobulin domain-containing protein, partial [Candidatus Sulfotelmatobacter sp.]|nr:immunoglobulin domain-containing protein [Candidatus Sulfotelmatobacter sp.]